MFATEMWIRRSLLRLSANDEFAASLVSYWRLDARNKSEHDCMREFLLHPVHITCGVVIDACTEQIVKQLGADRFSAA